MPPTELCLVTILRDFAKRRRDPARRGLTDAAIHAVDVEGGLDALMLRGAMCKEPPQA